MWSFATLTKSGSCWGRVHVCAGLFGIGRPCRLLRKDFRENSGFVCFNFADFEAWAVQQMEHMVACQVLARSRQGRICRADKEAVQVFCCGAYLHYILYFTPFSKNVNSWEPLCKRCCSWTEQRTLTCNTAADSNSFMGGNAVAASRAASQSAIAVA